MQCRIFFIFVQMEIHYGAGKRIFKFANALRKPLTPAEERFWQMVRNRNLLNLKFRRQHPIDCYVADFYCHELKLVIEIDGDVHDLEHIKQYDKNREDNLRALGLEVLRFKNGDVFANTHLIEEAIKERQRVFASKE
jgi:very-short-patch-repair endonuclease